MEKRAEKSVPLSLNRYLFFFFCDFHMYDIFICRGDDDDDNDSSGEKDANLPYFF